MSLPLKEIALSVALTAALSSGQLLADDYAKGLAAYDKNDFATAVQFFTKAIEQDPNDTDAFAARGSVWCKKHEYDKGIADFNEAIRLDPKNGRIYLVRGTIWKAKGDFDKALADFDVTISLDPREVAAHHQRGSAWLAKGDFDKALNDFDESIRLEPSFVATLDQRARLRATCPQEKYRDGAKAIADATKANELTEWRSPYFLGTLAAAYAESGQFDKAVEWQQKAIDSLAAAYAEADQQKIELAQETKDARKKEFQDRLKLYQEGKPYRVEPGKK